MSSLREALAALPGAAFADLLESDDAYLVLIDLPGATAETTDVRVEDGVAYVEAQRSKSTPEGFRYVREKRQLFVDAELPLPPDAVGEEASASIDAGVLELVIPKREGGDGITIEVQDA